MEYLSLYPLCLPRKFLIIGASAAVFLSLRGSTRYWVTQVGERSSEVLLKSSFRSSRGVLVTSFRAGRFSEMSAIHGGLAFRGLVQALVIIYWHQTPSKTLSYSFQLLFAAEKHASCSAISTLGKKDPEDEGETKFYNHKRVTISLHFLLGISWELILYQLLIALIDIKLFIKSWSLSLK